MAAAATPSPAATAPALHSAAVVPPAPKLAEPNARRPIRSAASRPVTPPTTPDERCLCNCEPGEAGDSRAARAQERLLAAAVVRAGTRDDERQQCGEQRARKAEEEEGDARVEAVAARWSSAAARLLPTTPVPARRVSRFFAGPAAAANALVGSRGSAPCASSACTWWRAAGPRRGQRVEQRVPAGCAA